MRKRAFTLVELIVVVVVIGVLATLGFPTYQNVIEDSKAKVCQENLKAINAALDIYAMEHDNIPADLSELPSQYLQRAYARILQEKGSWKIKLAYFIVGWQERGLAYAGLLTDELTKGTPNLRRCPSVALGNRSYGFNTVIKGISSRQYRALAGSILVVGDSDSATGEFTGTNLTARHKRYKVLSSPDNYALGCKKDKEISEVIKSSEDKINSGSITETSSGHN